MSQDISAAASRPGKPAVQPKQQPPQISNNIQALFQGIGMRELARTDPKPELRTPRTPEQQGSSIPQPFAQPNGRLEIKQRKIPNSPKDRLQREIPAHSR